MWNIVKNDETLQVGKRTIVNLNGTWKVGESVEAETDAVVFDHTAPVPGLLSSAQPPFEKVGDFETRFRQYCKDNWRTCTGGKTDLPLDEAALKHHMGVAYQDRNYFWYKRTFRAPQKHSFATLAVLKARYGSKVWLNGQTVGESISCFTSEKYDVSDVLRWDQENEIVLRVGAHQGVLPEGNTCNEDCEQEKWYPGIWDDIELYCYNNPAITSVQIAPKINPKQILVETELTNQSNEKISVKLIQQVKTKDLQSVLAEHTEMYALEAGEIRVVQCEISLEDAKLWTPDTPPSVCAGNLYGGRLGAESLRTAAGLFPV